MAAPAQLYPLLPQATAERLRRLTADAFVSSASPLRWCPRPGCGAVVAIRSAAGADSGQPSAGGHSADFALEAAQAGRALDTGCGTCGTRFCWGCGAGAHEPASCAQMRGWAALTAAAEADGALASDDWLAAHTQACPSCGSAIQKNDGCNHMTCRCGHQFCWVCRQAWCAAGSPRVL